LSLPAIHRHIAALEDAGFVERKKFGRENFLALDRSGMLLTQEWVGEFKAYWGTSKESLSNYVAAIARAKSATRGTKQ
jgi:hypothetical protein